MKVISIQNNNLLNRNQNKKFNVIKENRGRVISFSSKANRSLGEEIFEVVTDVAAATFSFYVRACMMMAYPLHGENLFRDDEDKTGNEDDDKTDNEE